MSSKKKPSPKKGTGDSARKFTIIDRNRQPSAPTVSGNSAGKPRTVSTDEDLHYSDDFDDHDIPQDSNNPLFFVGTSIDELIHPLDEFTNQVHDGSHDHDDDEENIYDESFDNASVPTSPTKYRSEHKDKDGTSDEEDKDLRQLSSVTFGEEDSDIPYEPNSNSDVRGSSAHRASSQQTVKRVFTAPKHRMIVTPARSVVSSNGRSQSQPDSNSQRSRIPRPPKSDEPRSSKAAKAGVKFERIRIGGAPSGSTSPRAAIKADPSLPTVGDASKSVASSHYASSKGTLPTKGSSTVVTTKYGASSDHGSIFHAQQRWHEAELQRQLQVANKRVEDYRRANDILQEKLDASNVQVTIDQLKYELASKNKQIKELQKENTDLKFLARYQQKELVDQDLKDNYDTKMSQEKYIELLSLHISKLRQRVAEQRVAEEKHIEDWEASQSTIKKLRGKITKLKRTIEQQKEELSDLKAPAVAATDEDNQTLANESTIAPPSEVQVSATASVGNMSSLLHEEGSLASHLADYVGSKVERRYLAKIQVLKRDLETARHEAEDATSMQKNLEHELERRELLVRRQNHELRDLKGKYEELTAQYKQLFHGCEMFLGDSSARQVKKPAPKPITPPPPTPPTAPEVIIPVLEAPVVVPTMGKAAMLAGDEEIYDDDNGVADIQGIDVDVAFDRALSTEEPATYFFLTESEDVVTESNLDASLPQQGLCADTAEPTATEALLAET